MPGLNPQFQFLTVICFGIPLWCEMLSDTGQGVSEMRKSTIAALMSLVIPGSGLFYCGRVRLALVNIVIALVVPLVAVWAGFPGEHVLWLILALAAGSAGFAHATAEKLFSASE